MHIDRHGQLRSAEFSLRRIRIKPSFLSPLHIGILFAFCVMAIIAIPAWAQVDIGQISGTVVDTSKAAMPGVVVTVTNLENQVSRQATTNATGFYSFPNLMVGTYSVSAEAKGFSKYVKSDIHLDAAAQLDVSFQMTVGSVSQTVEVSGSAPAISLETLTGGTVTTQQFKQLEVNGRNPVYLALLEPGVVGTDIATFDPDSVSSGSFAMNGGRTDAYTVYVDGAVATRTRESGSMLGAQDMESVQEVQVLTGNFDAQYGRSNAGQIRFVTKSGTSQFHGEAYEVVRNAFFDANSWQRLDSPIHALNSRPPQQNYNDYGFTIGGPIYVPGRWNKDRSKLFLFLAEEWISRRYQDTVTGIVPTAAMRTGDLSYLLSPTNTFFGKARVATDPSTGKPYPNNVIPQSELSTQGMAVLNGYPLPTPGFQEGSTNWINAYSVFSNLHKTTAKVDYFFNSKNHLYARGTFIPWHFNGPLDSTLGLYQGLWSRPNRTAIIDLTTTFSPTFLNDLSISGNSDGKGSDSYDSACGAPCERQTYGITYPYLYPNTKIAPQKMPNIAVTGLSTQDQSAYPGFWSGFVADIADNVTKILGNHTIMFGVSLERAGENDAIQLTTASAPQTENQNGAFQFLDTGDPVTTGLGMANALIGNFNTYAEFGAKPETPWIADSFELFGQDTWQVTHKLNVHYGLRYSVWPGWGTTDGTIAQFEPQYYNAAQAATINPSTGYISSGSPYNGVVLPGSGPTSKALQQFPILSSFTSNYHNLPASFVSTEWNLVQPRLGIAYEIMNNTVVRAGVGYFGNHTAVNRDTALGGNPPLMPQTSLIYGNISTLGQGSVTVPLTMTITYPRNVWPVAWDYNATVQHQFRDGFNLSAGFVGNRGIHLQRKRNLNQIIQLDSTYANPTINPNALRPYVGAGIIDQSENTGLSWYKALQVQFSKRTGPLTFSSSYTLSKSTDNTSSLTDVLPNSYNDYDYWGRSDFNVPQALTVSYVYNLQLHRNNGFIKTAVNGWALSGINQFEAGEPFSVRENIDYAGIGPGSGNQFWNITGNPNGCSTGFIHGVGATRYCKNAFTAPTLGTFATGQNRNVFSNPGFWEWNMAAHKQFPLPIHEGTTLEFRAEAFDVLNHANWGSTDATPLDASFMQVTSKSDNRNLQFQLKIAF